MWPDPLSLRVLPSPWRLLFSSSLAFSHLSPPNQRYCNAIGKELKNKVILIVQCEGWQCPYMRHLHRLGDGHRRVPDQRHHRGPNRPVCWTGSLLLKPVDSLGFANHYLLKLDWKSFPCYFPAVQGAWNNPSRLWGSSLLFQLISFNKIYCIYLCL